jgi:F-type H+-transporting ATPase subunit delta
MASDSVSRRYAESAFEAAKDHGTLNEVAAWLAAMRQLIASSEGLQELLANPDVDLPDKLGVLKRLLPEGWSPDVDALLQMTLSRWRADHLVAIAEDFQALVDREQGLVRVRVRSAHPLAPAAKTRLQQVLERREGRRVEMTEESAPELLGGLQILLESRMIDGSLRMHLDRLRQQLKQVRV